MAAKRLFYGCESKTNPEAHIVHAFESRSMRDDWVARMPHKTKRQRSVDTGLSAPQTVTRRCIGAIEARGLLCLARNSAVRHTTVGNV